MRLKVPNRLKSLEQRLLGEVMGWHARKPFELVHWAEDNLRVLYANLDRIDVACAALLAERKRVKELRKSGDQERNGR